jgi:hypothetical protein
MHLGCSEMKCVPNKAEHVDKNMTLVDAEEQVNRTLVKSVSSTIRHFKNHSFARLLRGEDFFWGQSPAKDESLTIILRFFFNYLSNCKNSDQIVIEMLRIYPATKLKVDTQTQRRTF